MLSVFLFAAVQHLINELPKSYTTHIHTHADTVTDTVTDTVAVTVAVVDSHRLLLSQLLLYAVAWLRSWFDGSVSRMQNEI